MDNVKLSQTVQAKPHIIIRKEKNCYLLVNRENGAVLAVNDLGIEMWKYLTKRTTIERVVRKLAEKYKVGFESSKMETLKFIEELLKNDFLKMRNCESC